jgi:protein O-GlcNAc transferase
MDIQEAFAHHRAGRLTQAGAIYRQILQNDSNHPDALHFLGVIALQEGNSEAAVELIGKAIRANPSDPVCYINLGNALKKQGKLDAAADSYHKALARKPEAAEAHFNLGVTLRAQGRPDLAVEHFHKALLFKPDFAGARSNLGLALQDIEQLDNAIARHRWVVQLHPDFAETHNNLGNLLQKNNCLPEAETAYLRALALQPDFVEAYANLGGLLHETRRMPEACAAYLRVLELRPEHPFALGMYLRCKMCSCNWEGFDDIAQKLLRGVDAGKAISSPFDLLTIPSSAAQQRRSAEIWVPPYLPETAPPVNFNKKRAHGKIRLGYFSSDFYNHATTHLMAGMIEQHDRSKFEVIGLSFGTRPNDEMRQRISAAFDRFIDVHHLSDQEIAALARALEIDIAVDLNGLCGDARTSVFALRPAPIQVNYLGYPGTMGASYIDYLIADPTLIPSDQQQNYSEKIAYLPDTYQVNDSQRRIAERQFTRAEVGLPDEGFVFCCFNSNYKITPVIFDNWIQLLREVDGSVLWLLGDDIPAQNLQNEAKKRGIAPQRLVFAPRMELPDHLARHRLADLFLDTFYYNAHTTASDALWAGLPVLTYLGDTFAARVAASLLNAVGLPELITRSHAEYRALAVELATHPEKLASIKQRLATNRTTHPLFDTALFTRHIESAYTLMWERHQQSLPPDHLYVGNNADLDSKIHFVPLA